MLRKTASNNDSDSLLSKIQNQLHESKNNATRETKSISQTNSNIAQRLVNQNTALNNYMQPSSSNTKKPLPKPHGNVFPVNGLMSSQPKSRSSQKNNNNKKSDSFENLFAKSKDPANNISNTLSATNVNSGGGAVFKKARQSEGHHYPEKLHESFSYQTQQPAYPESSKNATKSLHFTEFTTTSDYSGQQSQTAHANNIRVQDYFQKYANLLNRCSNTTNNSSAMQNMSQNNNMNSTVQNTSLQVNPNNTYLTEGSLDPLNSQKDRGITGGQNLPVMIAGDWEDTKIQDINSLINLIDNCVEEANSYISDLTNKLAVAQTEVENLKKVNQQLLEINQSQEDMLRQKEAALESATRSNQSSANKNEDIKSLLKIVGDLTTENDQLKQEIENLKNEIPKSMLFPEVVSQIKKRSAPNTTGSSMINSTSTISTNPTNSLQLAKDIYSEIYQKIDILNISVPNQDKSESQSIPYRGGIRDNLQATYRRASQNLNIYPQPTNSSQYAGNSMGGMVVRSSEMGNPTRQSSSNSSTNKKYKFIKQRNI